VNTIAALADGARKSLAIVINVAANLIAFVAVVHFVNATLTWFGQRVGVEKLTYEVTQQ